VSDVTVVVLAEGTPVHVRLFAVSPKVPLAVGKFVNVKDAATSGRMAMYNVSVGETGREIQSPTVPVFVIAHVEQLALHPNPAVPVRVLNVTYVFKL